jgi:DNA mismatch repair protein MutS
MGLIEDYFAYYNKYQKEYGENTVVLMQVGSFFEAYELSEPISLGNASKVANILNFVYTSKNKKLQSGSMSNPHFCGFGLTQLTKYLPILIDNDFIVIVVEQIGNEIQENKMVKRKVTGIYSGSLQPLDFNFNDKLNLNLVNVLIEFLPELKSVNTSIKKYLVSICSINNFTNEILIEETTFDILNENFDEITSFIQTYSPRECIIRTINENLDLELTNFKFERINRDTLKIYSKIDYQNEYFKKVYKHYDMGFLQPIEFLNLEMYPCSVLNFMFSIDFIGKHDNTYINNLNLPNVIQERTFLKLPLDTIQQLHIIENTKSNVNNLFNTINNTSTSIGKRYLKQLLIKPFINKECIESRYTLTEKLKTTGNLIDIEKSLNKILDFERLHRKMGTNTLQPCEFFTLSNCYDYILELSDVCKNFYEIDPGFLNELIKYKNEYNCTFDLNKIQHTSKEDMINFFNKGHSLELDTIENDIIEIEKNIEKVRLKYDLLINEKNSGDFIKLNSTENEGYFFYCTKIRYNVLLKKLSKKEVEALETRITSNMCKIFTPELNKLSKELLLNKSLLNTKIKLQFSATIQNYYLVYYKLFNYLKHYIEIIDITKSNLKTSLKYNYCKPIVTNGVSFLEAKDIRHPIIEKISKTSYITNDIDLNNNSPGMLLYGLNSSGKSSLLRAIGMNIILAQCGLYVACSNFKYSPFKTLISQVDLTDDLSLGKSSFINEMCSLKKILMCSANDTLVLADELCRGTENFSATSIVTSTIIKLLQTNTKFFFTSHLHDIPNIKSIKKENKIQIKHLSVISTPETIIFDRKLKDGPGQDLYGLEVAKTILQDTNFIDTAFEIRNELKNNKTEIMSTKKSKYNSKKIVDKCEICSSTKQLETDHVKEQSSANEKGYLNDGRHKNNISNLCTLCHECHLQKTLGKIKIYGYKDSLSGLFLDWEKVK